MFQQQGKYEEALAQYHQGIACNPDQESRYWIQLANTLVKVQKFDEAVISYQKVIEL